MRKIGFKRVIIVLFLIILAVILWFTIGKEFFKKELTSFELIGEKDIYVLVNGNYDDLGAAATVNGSDYSKNIKITNNCDTSKIGDCTIVYSIKGFDKILERTIHVSDSSDWFKTEYDSETGQEQITINITFDKEKLSRYVLPNGSEKDENGNYIIEKNGTYTFKIYDNYNNSYEREIIIKNIVIKQLEAECSAKVGQKTTVIQVKTNKKIIKYIYNGVSSESDTYTFNKRSKTNNVTIYDVDNQSKSIVCKTEVEPYNSFGTYKHVFIIGVDGMGAALSKVSSPNFDRIFGSYAYRYDAQTEKITISAQNWGSILNGVACGTHKYTNDSIANNKHTSKSKYLSIFYYVYKNIADAKLVSVTNWKPINYGIIENNIGVKMYYYGSDKNVVAKANEFINSNNTPTLMFVHLGNVDDVGHASGGFSQKYYNAVKTADTRIGQIYDTINKKGLMKDSLFILVADHGMTKNGHGGNSKEEKSVVVAVRGYSVNKVILNKDVHNRDVSAIALYALGIEKPSSYISTVPSELFGEPRY